MEKFILSTALVEAFPVQSNKLKSSYNCSLVSLLRKVSRGDTENPFYCQSRTENLSVVIHISPVKIQTTQQIISCQPVYNNPCSPMQEQALLSMCYCVVVALVCQVKTFVSLIKNLWKMQCILCLRLRRAKLLLVLIEMSGKSDNQSVENTEMLNLMEYIWEVWDAP